jgi:hypothetical protein
LILRAIAGIWLSARTGIRYFATSYERASRKAGGAAPGKTRKFRAKKSPFRAHIRVDGDNRAMQLRRY